MDAQSRELERRTKAFALRVLALVAGFPKTRVSDAIGYQLEGSAEAIESPPVSEMRRFAPIKRLR